MTQLRGTWVGGTVTVQTRRYGRGILEIDRDEVRSPLRQVRVSVIIPVLNEALNLPHVFGRLPRDVFEVIVVDGGSTDGSPEVAREQCPGVRIIDQDRCGKGNALECGFRAVRGDVVVTIDADGSTDPSEIPRFVSALLNGADYAKGSRFTGGGRSLDITRFRQKGNRVLCAIVNRLYRTGYTDLCYGFNAFWRHTLPALGYDFDDNSSHEPGQKRWGDGFEVETLLNVRAANADLKVTEVPSIEWARIHGDSKLNAISDGFRVLSIIGMERRYSKKKAASGGSFGHQPRLELNGNGNGYQPQLAVNGNGYRPHLALNGNGQQSPVALKGRRVRPCCAYANTLLCNCAEDAYA